MKPPKPNMTLIEVFAEEERQNMKTQPNQTSEGNAPRVKHPSLAWSPYMEKARLIATDAQLSSDVGVIARLLLAEAQRDELLAALKPIVEQTKPAHIAEGMVKAPTMKQWQAAQAAIAKAEGRAQ